jgi:hypothetical protein
MSQISALTDQNTLSPSQQTDRFLNALKMGATNAFET